MDRQVWLKLIPTWTQLLVGFVVATMASVFLTSLWYFAPSRSDPSDVTTVYWHYSIICYGWAVLVIFVKPAVEWVGWDSSRIMRSILLLLLVGIICSVAHFVLTGVVVWGVGLMHGKHAHSPLDSWPRLFGVLQSNLLLYFVIASSCLALSNDRKFRERSLRASRLESQLATAKLEALKGQLQPHFLFNSLNAIASLTQENPDVAEKMVVRLGELLRSTLELKGDDLHSLECEIELALKYLSIEQLRFGDRLNIDVAVTDQAAHANVPTLIIQPLVENSIRHGVGQTVSACRVSIKGEARDGRLLLTVQDDGVGNQVAVRDAIDPGSGVGIRNCRQRLECLFGDDFSFQSGPGSNGGFLVSIDIPFLKTGLTREGTS